MNRSDPFQNDYAFISSAIKDANLRKIPCNKYPVLSVTYPEVDHDVTRKEEEDFQLFRHIQRGHLERGQYRNAVWNSVETNWMPVAKRNETDVDLIKEHVVSIKNHFKQYSKYDNRELIDTMSEIQRDTKRVIDRPTRLIDAKQAGELTEILKNKIDRLTAGTQTNPAGPPNQ